MTVPANPTVVRRLRVAAGAGGIATAMTGVLVLAGWAFDVSRLKGVGFSLATMKPNTAFAFILLGAAVWLAVRARYRRTGRVLAALAAILGGLTLLEYVLGWDLGIDEIVFRDARPPRPHQPPGRMSPMTATNLLFVGTALVILDVRLGRSARRPSEWLALLAGLSGLLACFGYAYGVAGLYAVGPYSSVALHTALAFLVCSASILFARPEEGLMRFVSSDSPAGVVSRRLLPAALLAPPLVGWLRLRGELTGLYDTRFGLALFASSNVVVFVTLVWMNARLLFRSDAARIGAEAQVRDSEEDLRITLDSIGDGVIATDSGGRVVRMNPVAEQLTGWRSPEARGRPLSDVFHIINEDTRATIESPVDRVLREGTIVGLANHTALIARDGTERAIADSGAPIRDGQGTLRGVVLVFRDQSEDRRAERALRETEARKAAVMEAALDCIVVMDREGAIVDFNPAAERTFGHPRADALGKPLVELLVPPALRERHRAGLARYLETGEGPIIGKRIEITALRANGEEFPVEVAVVGNNTEGPPEFTGYIRDITERIRATAELRLSDARFRRLAESGIMGIVLADTAGTIHEVNDTFLKIVGYTRDDFTGGRIRAAELTPPEWRDAQAAARRELMAHGATRPWEKEFVRKDGSRVPVLIGVAMLEPPNVINVILDLTEQKQAEAALRKLEAEREAEAKFREELRRAKDTAEAASRELEAFSYSVAHDLRAPLRGINGYATALVEDLGDKLDGESKDYLERMVAAATRMGSLIDTLLGLSRVSRTQLARARVNLGDIAREVVARLRESDPDRSVELVVSDDLVAEGDAHLVQALLENLLGNAWKFTSKRAMARIEIGRTEHRGTFSYFVRDNGAGFDMAYADKLFAPFQRLHAASEFVGTGIGLATVQRIVRRHGGTISAEGAVDQGATFYFTLEAAEGGRT